MKQVKKNSKRKTSVQTILFDLDGTIIDTEPAAARTIQECFKIWGIQIEPQDAAYVTGRTWDSAFSYLFGKYRLPVSSNEAKTHMMSLYRKTLEADLCLVPGSVKAVESLASHFSLGLVSGSVRSDILWALRKLNIEQHFEVILGAEDYPQSKPQPDGYLKAIQTLDTEPQLCLIFEDSTAGIASARAAGAWVVAITATNHFQQDHSLAHFKIRDLTEVDATWIQNLSFD
jgi:HAD superfamily hydrolase (TIGR01509 family)